ncbi:hypothetical protein CONCODRAFT_68558 [Conidiobolus coronatus NRRL 28638]|uniref:Transmembrane protein n=1 Tax=Conidiobolus coronatus (strain ATCC 28846 / CBS 209.66 / NRRL 28638) TaxID=796925 RepID=A0A137PDL8_CONC2|nr:hypothetical protein CONCODRAFT_68558 [Conidiobolus coronatus NRRL 28638]|eukprot:KXN73031.1 hypothetical protein CONCODRAFT_68558 [Conidiobolus coronatus NRRL 28638]
MKTSGRDNQPNSVVYKEEEYKKIPLNRSNILKLLKLANKQARKGAFIASSLVIIGGLLTDKRFNIKKIIRRPALLFCYSILTEILPIITNWSLLKSDIIAGLLTGWIIAFETPQQQAFISLWGFTNFIQASCSIMYRENILRVPYGAQLIYSSFVAQLLYSLLYHPLSLPVTELNILKSIIPLGSIRNLFLKHENEGYDPTLFEIVAGNKSGETFDTLCSHSHSESITCERNSLKTGVHFAKANFAYFVIISVIPTLILDFKSIKRRPFLVFASKLMNLTQTLGTILLTSTLLNYQVCKSSWAQSTRENPSSWRYLSIIQAFLAGLASMNSATSLYNILRKKGLIFKIPYFFPILYSVFYTAMLTLMRHYPSILTPIMVFGLNSFFGKERLLKPDQAENNTTQEENEDNQISDKLARDKRTNRIKKDYKYNNID